MSTLGNRNDNSNKLNLVLSTWFIMYLREDLPGGLPNDFLTRGASSLLLFDEVLCDRDAFHAEEKFKGNWLSSDLFLALKQEGLIKPINMKDYISKDFFDHLDSSGISQSALRIMEKELNSIKNKEKSIRELKIPKALTTLNHYMFTGLNIPNSLRYEWQENHFKILPSTLANTICSGQMNIPETDREESITTVLRTILPEFQVLPPISGREAKAALRTNITKEKVALYRWIYGDPDMPRDKYHDLRLGIDFSLLDKKIDENRRATAWNNLEILLKVREKTKDVRVSVQEILNDVVEGKRSALDVKQSLLRQQEELLSYLPTKQSVTMDAALGGVGLAVAMTELIASQIGLWPGITPLTPMGVGLATFEFWKAAKEKKEYRYLRNRYPFAWFLRDFRHVYSNNQIKRIPRKWRAR